MQLHRFCLALVLTKLDVIYVFMQCVIKQFIYTYVTMVFLVMLFNVFAAYTQQDNQTVHDTSFLGIK